MSDFLDGGESLDHDPRALQFSADVLSPAEADLVRGRVNFRYYFGTGENTVEEYAGIQRALATASPEATVVVVESPGYDLERDALLLEASPSIFGTLAEQLRGAVDHRLDMPEGVTAFTYVEAMARAKGLHVYPADLNAEEARLISEDREQRMEAVGAALTSLFSRGFVKFPDLPEASRAAERIKDRLGDRRTEMIRRYAAARTIKLAALTEAERAERDDTYTTMLVFWRGQGQHEILKLMLADDLHESAVYYLTDPRAFKEPALSERALEFAACLMAYHDTERVAEIDLLAYKTQILEDFRELDMATVNRIYQDFTALVRAAIDHESDLAEQDRRIADHAWWLVDRYTRHLHP